MATIGPQVVGTVTLIGDSPLGLPMDEIYQGDLDRFRAQRCRLAEASALAAHPRYRGIGLPLLLPLLRVLVTYAADLAALDLLCIAVNPRHVEFYRRLTFEIFGELKPYAKVNGAPAVALCLHLDRVREIAAAMRTRERRRDDLASVFFTGSASLRGAERLQRQMPAASAASASFVGQCPESAAVINGVGVSPGAGSSGIRGPHAVAPAWEASRLAWAPAIALSGAPGIMGARGGCGQGAQGAPVKEDPVRRLPGARPAFRARRSGAGEGGDEPGEPPDQADRSRRRAHRAAPGNHLLDEDEGGERGHPRQVHHAGHEQERHDRPAAAHAEEPVTQAHREGPGPPFAPLAEQEAQRGPAAGQAGVLEGRELVEASEHQECGAQERPDAIPAAGQEACSAQPHLAGGRHGAEGPHVTTYPPRKRAVSTSPARPDRRRFRVANIPIRGAADGSIMATIMTAHMRKVSAKSAIAIAGMCRRWSQARPAMMRRPVTVTTRSRRALPSMVMDRGQTQSREAAGPRSMQRLDPCRVRSSEKRCANSSRALGIAQRAHVSDDGRIVSLDGGGARGRPCADAPPPRHLTRPGQGGRQPSTSAARDRAHRSRGDGGGRPPAPPARCVRLIAGRPAGYHPRTMPTIEIAYTSAADLAEMIRTRAALPGRGRRHPDRPDRGQPARPQRLHDDRRRRSARGRARRRGRS